MKKFATTTLAIILAIAMILALTACGGNEAAPTVTPTPTPASTPAPTPTPTPTPTPEPEEEENDNLRIRGSIDENVYTSEYLGLSITTPGSISLTSNRNFDTWGIPQYVIEILENDEIPPDYWEYRSDFNEVRAEFDSRVITINFISLMALDNSFEEFFQIKSAELADLVESAELENVISDDKLHIGNFHYYEITIRDESRETVRMSRTQLFAEDVDNNIAIVITIHWNSTRSLSKSDALERTQEIFSWITPYP